MARCLTCACADACGHKTATNWVACMSSGLQDHRVRAMGWQGEHVLRPCWRPQLAAAARHLRRLGLSQAGLKIASAESFHLHLDAGCGLRAPCVSMSCLLTRVPPCGTYTHHGASGRPCPYVLRSAGCNPACRAHFLVRYREAGSLAVVRSSPSRCRGRCQWSWVAKTEK